MKLHLALVTLIALTLTACGSVSMDDSGDPTGTPTATPSPTPEPLELTSGLYEVSGLFVGVDECFEFSTWDNGDRLGVDVAGPIVEIASLYAMDQLTDTTFEGQLISEVDFRPNYDCVQTASRLFDGQVTAPNTFRWNLSIERRVSSGTECDLAFAAPLPCESSAGMVLSILN